MIHHPTQPANSCKEHSYPDFNLPRATLLANAAMVVADLDQTLIKTTQAHRALVSAYVASLVPSVPADTIDKKYSQLRGQSYGNILEGMRSLCAQTERAFSMSAAEFVGGFNAFLSQKPSNPPLLEEIPGARELLGEIRTLRLPLVVCTGSPRPLAELFLRQTGMDAFLSGENLFCWGDTQYSKADAEFWKPILKDEDRSRIIAIDDHPHSVEYVLSAGNIGGVIALPSVAEEQFDAICRTYPDRIKLVKDSWNSWE